MTDATFRRMFDAKPSLLTVALVCAGLFSGCSTVSKVIDAPIDATGQEEGWVQELGSAPAAAMVELPTSNQLRLQTVSAGRAYTAASGRECRQLSNADEQALMRLICKQDDVWYLTRSLSALLEGESPSVVPRVLSSSASEDEKPETVLVLASTDDNTREDGVTSPPATRNQSFVVAPGETLWSFTQRVTGNPMQWKSIAAHNGIAQAVSLKSGAVLEVPASLISAN